MEERKIKDSGGTREFGTGAHRDNAAGKGRFDLLPVEPLKMAYNAAVLKIFGEQMDGYIKTAPEAYIRELLIEAMQAALLTQNMEDKQKILAEIAKVAAYITIAAGLEEDIVTNDVTNGKKQDGEAYFWYGIIQVSKHYEEGANKYGANNWKNGMPTNVYMDSCMRHIAKALAGMDDEYHIRAAAWNVLCFLWTAQNLPTLDTYCAK